MYEFSGIRSAFGEADRALLIRIAQGMLITADLSRSDLMLVCPDDQGQLVVAVQAQPHSISSLYDASLLGQVLTQESAPVVINAWQRRHSMRVQRELIPTGAPIVQSVHPIKNSNGQIIGLFCVETSLIQLERHRQRHVSFRRAIEWLKWMCRRGELADTEKLSPFGEWDGVLLVDVQRRITYLSGIANNLYRRLGYMEDLRGKRLAFLNTTDDEMVLEALASRKPLERKVKEGDHIWIRKVLPVWPTSTFSGWLQSLSSRHFRTGEVAAVIIMVHDATEDLRKQQELQVKTTMIQEVHHRVKNNLQAIAAMLRMQARRTENAEALRVLDEATARILTIAVIHEFLSLEETQQINIRDVGQRIINQSRQVVGPDKHITLSAEGPPIYLPSQQATVCALVINELIQNALEHGFESHSRGEVQLLLVDGGDQVTLEVCDDGEQLPVDFDLSTPTSLGLQIVHSLVEDDLQGQLRLENRADKVIATVQFPKPRAARNSRPGSM